MNVYRNIVVNTIGLILLVNNQSVEEKHFRRRDVYNNYECS